MALELLQNVRLMDAVAGSDRPCDLWLHDGHIAAVSDAGSAAEPVDFPDNTERRDCTGLVLGPGLVDLYSQSGEPGHESRETLTSLCAAATAGGFTRIALLPTTQPAIDNPASVDWVRSAIASRSASHPFPSMPQVYLWAAFTQGASGQQLSELTELAATPIVGFADGRPLTNPLLLRRLLEYAQALNKPLALWCCDPAIQSGGVMRDGVDAIRVGLPGTPVIAETAPLAALIETLVDLSIAVPVHVMRISTARGVEQIAQAKAAGLPITASTSWMHLLLSTQALSSYHPSLRLEPPLGTPADRAALVHAIESGVLDAIAIDHTPYTYEEKTVPFAEAPPGAIGLELALPLLWQGLVETQHCSALALWRALSCNPARCMGQTLEAILPESATANAPKSPAELTLFDPNQHWVSAPQHLQSLSHNTPWLHHPIQGRVLKTWQPKEY